MPFATVLFNSLASCFGFSLVSVSCKAIRAADAKEVGVGNPAEETYRYPNQNRFRQLN